MNLKKVIISSLLIAIGFIFSLITPPILLGMRPDFLLPMMFITILLNDDYKMTLIIGGTVGILTAVTTTFPGGQVANIVDKIITCQCVFLAFRFTKDRFNTQLRIAVISFLGTILSGSAFLSTAGFLFGLPGGQSFFVLVFAVVIPAAIANTVITAILYNTVVIALKRTSLYGKLFSHI